MGGEGRIEERSNIQNANMVDGSSATGDFDQRQRGKAAESTDSISGWPARLCSISGVLAPPSIMAAAELFDNGR